MGMDSSNEMFVPKTLQEAITYFSDDENTFRFAVSLRWPDGVSCPFCGSAEQSFISTRKLWKCKACKKQFSVRVGTIFEDSALPLRHWFLAIWMLVNCKNGVSSYELHRAIGVTQKTAWFMLHRIRAAIKAKSFDRKLAGIVETDETFIGGLLENMHESRREQVRAETIKGRIEKARRGPGSRRVRTGQGPVIGKTVVQAVLERDGEVRAQIIERLVDGPMFDFIKAHVEKGAQLMSDQRAAGSYGAYFVHDFVNHQREYVRGNVHTQGIENFWSLLKRGLHGTYVSVEPYHLSAYVDEQCFRFNTRKQKDGTRFALALGMTKGCRLTYDRLTRAEQA
jgi:transposase-like protein